MKNCYFWATPSGPIRLIEGDKMPVMPEFKGDYFLHYGPQKQYEAALQAAKASGIPVKDQERAAAMIREQYRFVGDLRLDFVYGPFNISYEIRYRTPEGIQLKSKRYFKRGEILADMKEVIPYAILYDDTPEKEEQDAFLLHLIDVTACYVMEQNMYLETPTRKELIKKARETFTITRKQ